MDTRQNVEYKMVSEFISKTGANPDDALACLKTWGWDMKRALTDYNDTCAVDLIDLIDEDDENSKESVVVLRNNSSSLNNKYKQQQQQQQQQKYQEINKTIAPVLCKQDSIDLIECKKLFRGISRATDNVGIVSRARHEIAKDFYKSLKRNDNTNNFQYLVDTPDSTFILPNIYNYPEDFRIFIEKDLIEMSTLNALEQSQRLNWWADSNVCRKLWPLATTGDGNCLLHAASLGIWGFHDRKLTLRTALYSVLSDGKFKDELRRRWRFQQTQFNKRAGFVYSESEWSKEWDDIISMASPEPRKSINNHNYNNPTTTTATTTTTRNNDDYRRRISFLGRNSITENEVLDNNLSTSSSSTTAATTAAVYESLEEIHILALAHVLRRAIIVISDTVLKDLHGEAMAPITFGGIYLPFEIEPKECNRGPLLLAYDMAHFSALVPMENGSDYPPALVPLTDYENILLPIQFCIDPGEDFDWKLYNGNEDNWSLTEREHIALLKEYLDVVYVGTNRSPDDEIYEDIEDEFEKKFIESEIIIPTSADYITTNTSEEANNNNNCNGKSKASRQLHSVAKQFGSIGKNMSRKLKKNIGSIAKLGGKNVQKKNSFTGMGGTSLSPPYICSRILCARLRLKRHEYQEEMIRNYLECAQNRFIEAEKNKEQKLLSSTGNITGTTIQQQQQQPTVVAINTGINTLNKDECSNNGSSSRSNNRSNLDSLSITQNDNNMSILQQQEFNEHSYCINAGCNQLATFETSYLCPECFEKQKKHENLQYFNSSPRYGTGNSKFYTQADIQSHDSIRKLPSLKKLNELDQTLYLSNSTFYNDVLPSYDEVEHLNNRESHRKYTTSISSSSHQPLSASSSSSSSSTTTPSPSQSQSSSNGSCNNAINNKKSLSAENNSSLLSPVLITKIHISNDNDDNERNRKNNLHQHLHLKQQQQQPHNHQLIVTGITSPSSIPITKPCKTLGCPFYGNSSTNFLCSKCLKATTGSIITTSRNQHDYDYYQHNKNYNHNHSHHNESSFKLNPIYTAPSPPTPPPPPKSATSTTTLYKSESKITSDI